MASPPPIVLTFAASDPTSGAGLQADLLTFAAMGCHPVSVVTAITVQDTRGVEALEAIAPGTVAEQARCLLADLPVAAFKLGVLGSAANAEVVGEVLARYPEVPAVVDPVLASGRGDALADEELGAALVSRIAPLATVFTPNTLEAERLGGASALLAAGCRYVLVTGTHADTEEVINRLYDANGIVREDRWARLPGSFHGSGCTLASAIAAALANGLELSEAVQHAQEYTWQALASGFRPGRGQALPDRFFWVREGR